MSRSPTRTGTLWQRLAGLADLFLVHDRPIETRTDDSVVRPVLRRRSAAHRDCCAARAGTCRPACRCPAGRNSPLLACGAELKSTFCLANGERAWVSHHIGDLENYETLRSFTDGIEHFKRLFAVQPAIVAHDLHPEYLSTKYALECDGAELIGVQHHHAHLAACLAEHGLEGPAVGVIFDGTGYGTDGAVWGGELLYGDLSEFRRVGMLRPVRLPGGERAIRQPWRMACAWLAPLSTALLPSVRPVSSHTTALLPSFRLAHRPGLGGSLAGRLRADPQWRGLAADQQHGPAVRRRRRAVRDPPAVNYEGQAAIELERACDPAARGAYPLDGARLTTAMLVLDPRETIRAVASRRAPVSRSG